MLCNNCDFPIRSDKKIGVNYNGELWSFCNKECRNLYITNLPETVQNELMKKNYCCGNLDPKKTSSSYVCGNCGIELDIQILDNALLFQKRESMSIRKLESYDDFYSSTDDPENIERDY